MEKLFVLAGKARSGKDSIASIIKEQYSLKKVLVYSCTTYLKKYVSLIYGWDGSEDTKPRDILQNLGREVKDIYPNFFIDRMRDDINFLSDFCDVMIITGVRLVSELEFLKKEFGAILIKVEKFDDNNLTEKQKKDITEVDVDNYNSFDFVIHNDEDFEILHDNVLKLIEEVER